MCVRPRPGLGGRRRWNETCGLRLCRSTTSSSAPRLLYPEYGGPERTNIAAGILRHGDAYCLDLGGVWLDLQPPRLDRDSAGQLNIALAQGPVLSGRCADGHSLRPEVNIGKVANGLGNRGDCRHEPGAML